jgi:DNA polymerase (family 10)
LEIGDLLELDDANVFRVKAYRNAARAISNHGKSLAEMVANGENLTTVPTVGADLATKIRQIVESGQCTFLAELHAKVPATLIELLRIPGLGPKRVKSLYKDLNIRGRDDLAHALANGLLREVPGFGKKMEQQLLEYVKANK